VEYGSCRRIRAGAPAVAALPPANIQARRQWAVITGPFAPAGLGAPAISLFGAPAVGLSLVVRVHRESDNNLSFLQGQFIICPKISAMCIFNLWKMLS
jgi:hypothetical protein